MMPGFCSRMMNHRVGTITKGSMTERHFPPALCGIGGYLPHYRFYELDADDKIVDGVDAECANDQAAYSAATSRLVDEASGEIWSGTRYVGRISHSRR
jgi:hypothetical protein